MNHTNFRVSETIGRDETVIVKCMARMELSQMDDENLRLELTWPVSTIDGVPSLTSGSLTISQRLDGGFLATVSVGDEFYPDGDEAQIPLSAAQAGLGRRALGGEYFGSIKG